MKTQVKDQLTTHKGNVAEGLGTVKSTLQATGQQLRDGNLAFLAEPTESFATQLEQATNYLRDKDIDAVTQDVQAFARRNPAVFIGGAFLLGIAVARFLKSSEAAPMAGTPRNGYGLMSPEETKHALVPVSPVHDVPMTNNFAASSGDTQSFDIDSMNATTSSTKPTLPPIDSSKEVFGDRPLTAHDYVPGVGVPQTSVAE